MGAKYEKAKELIKSEPSEVLVRTSIEKQQAICDQIISDLINR